MADLTESENNEPIRAREKWLPIAELAAYNLIQNLVLPNRLYVPSNLAVSAGLVAQARRHGSGWSDLRLGPDRLGSGLVWGATTISIAAGLISLLRLSGSRILLDQRAAGQGRRERLFRAAIRFPIGTALFEELAFRGVVEATWRQAGVSKRKAAGVSVLTFAAWHVLPTSRALGGNPLGTRLRSAPSRTAAVLGGAALAGLAGAGLSWLRERSGSLLAPWLVHAGFNTIGYLAADAAWRREQ
jgi:uncharacterized protein